MGRLTGDLLVMKKAFDDWLARQKKSYIVYTYKTCLEGNPTAHTIAPVIGEPKVNENGDTVFMTAMGGEITLKEGSFEEFESKKEAKQRYLDIIMKRFKEI